MVGNRTPGLILPHGCDPHVVACLLLRIEPFFLCRPFCVYARLCLGVLQRALEEILASSQGFTAGNMHAVVSAMSCRLGRARHGRDVEGRGGGRGLAFRPTACDRGTAATAGPGLEEQGVGVSWSDSHAAEALRAGFREVRGFFLVGNSLVASWVLVRL